MAEQSKLGGKKTRMNGDSCNKVEKAASKKEINKKFLKK